MGLRFFLFFLSTIIALATAIPGRAADNVLRVAFNSFPPSKVRMPDGTYGGSDIALLRLLAERMDLRLEFEDVPFKRGLKMVEFGDIDLSVGVLYRPERERYAHFLTPPYAKKTDKAFYVLKGKEHSLTCYEDLHKLVVGTQIGTRYFPFFDNDPAIAKSEVVDLHLNIRMLRAGRIDTFIVTENTGDKKLAEKGLTNIIVKAPYTYSEPQSVHMVLSKRSPLAARLDEFNHHLGELVESGAYQRILEEYLPDTAK